MFHRSFRIQILLQGNKLFVLKLKIGNQTTGKRVIILTQNYDLHAVTWWLTYKWGEWWMENTRHGEMVRQAILRDWVKSSQVKTTALFMTTKYFLGLAIHQDSVTVLWKK